MVLQLLLFPPDWRALDPYRQEIKDGKHTSCPMVLTSADGSRWRYVGGLLDGDPQYVRMVEQVELREERAA